MGNNLPGYKFYEEKLMTNYNKTAVEHALEVLAPEVGKEVEQIVEDKYSALALYDSIQDLDRQINMFLHRDGKGYSGKRENLAAIVLCAAVALYEWDKTRSTLPIMDKVEEALAKIVMEVSRLTNPQEDEDRL
jgi:hypothetical protein